MYIRMVLMVVCWRYRTPFDATGSVSTLVNVDWIKWMYFCVDEFEVGVNDSIFSGNEQQKVYYSLELYVRCCSYQIRRFGVLNYESVKCVTIAVYKHLHLCFLFLCASPLTRDLHHVKFAMCSIIVSKCFYRSCNSNLYIDGGKANVSTLGKIFKPN